LLASEVDENSVLNMSYEDAENENKSSNRISSLSQSSADFQDKHKTAPKVGMEVKSVFSSRDSFCVNMDRLKKVASF
jgi:hypothetical protein